MKKTPRIYEKWPLVYFTKNLKKKGSQKHVDFLLTSIVKKSNLEHLAYNGISGCPAMWKKRRISRGDPHIYIYTVYIYIYVQGYLYIYIYIYMGGPPHIYIEDTCGRNLYIYIYPSQAQSIYIYISIAFAIYIYISLAVVIYIYIYTRRVSNFDTL